MNNPVILLFTLGLSAMLVLYWVLSDLMIQPFQKKGILSPLKKDLLSIATLYLPGFLLMWLFIGALPVLPLPHHEPAVWDLLILLMAQFFAIILIGLFTFVEVKLTGLPKEALIPDKTPKSLAQSALIVLLVPVLEEVLARGLLGDRLAAQAPMLFICLSALVFSLMHLQTGRFAVALGMLYTGFLWALAYWLTGSLLYPCLMHILSNLLIYWLPDYLSNQSNKAQAPYMALLSLIGLTGFVLFLFNAKRLLASAVSPGLFSALRDIFTNPGIWVLIIVCGFRYLQVLRRRQKAQAV